MRLRVTLVGLMLATITFGVTGSSADPVSVAPLPPRDYPVSIPIAAPPPVAELQVFAPGTRAPDVEASTPLWSSVPVRIQISAIGVDSTLMALGLQANGEMEVPPSGFPAGWYTGAPTPGEMGPAIIAGHVDWDGPGVFYNLHKLKVDDEIAIIRQDGSVAVFRVNGVGQYPKDEFPTALVYGGIEYAGLRLVTCGGVFNRRTGHYEDNLVVYAELVRSELPVRAHVDLPAPVTGPRGLAGDVPPEDLSWMLFRAGPPVPLNIGHGPSADRPKQVDIPAGVV